MTARLPLAAACALLVAGCARNPPAAQAEAVAAPEPAGARARAIVATGDAVAGPQALGRPGDLVLENERIRVVIDALDRPHGFAHTGGNILDAAPRGGADRLNQVFTYFDDVFRRQAEYDSLAVADAGGPGRAAMVIASGADAWNAALRVRTRYRLEPGAAAVLLGTTVTNQGDRTIAEFELGDVIEWGAARCFEPGKGWRARGGRGEGPWIAGAAEGASYGYTIPAGEFATRHGRGWSDPVVRTVTLAPGDSASYERWFIVGDGDIASVAAEAARLRGERTRRLRWAAVEESSGLPVEGATLLVTGPGGKPLFEARSAAGSGSVELPAGECRLRARAPGRQAVELAAPAAEVGGAGELRIAFAAAGRWRFAVRDAATGEALPARLTLHGVPPFGDPDFGDPGALGPEPVSRGLAGEGRTLFSLHGSGEVPLAPGRYRLWAAHGTEWEMALGDVAVSRGELAASELSLRRAVETPGALAADFHVHTVASFDSPLAPEARVIGLAASGVEIVAVTDHNGVTDLEPWIARLQAGDRLRAFPGSEITTREAGHFNAFPLPGGFHPEGRSGRPEELAPRELFARVREQPGRPILQVNHPLHPGDGYFRRHELDLSAEPVAHRGFSWEFDTMEILNGDYVTAAESLLVVWAALWNAGRTVWGVGGSDAHELTGPEAGASRTYLHGAPDRPRDLDPERLVELVRAGRMTVTNGPWLLLEAQGRGPGETWVRRPGERGVLRVRLEAPAWARVSSVEVLENGRLLERFELAPGRDGEATRWSRELPLAPVRDAWYAAVARGPRFEGPESAAGNSRERRRPFAFTNPVRVDADGDGRWSAPGG